jgi:tungstate transport system ATP-binding protein
MVMHQAPSILPLTVRHLCFRVGGKLLLDNVGFVLPQGGITALIGPNGAGKSLILRLCHGMLTPTAGTVMWHASQSVRGTRRHAMVFQHPVMLRRSTLANVTHALAAVGAADARGGAASALNRFGLEALAAQPARRLSGGERQRVAIARAWALKPEVLLLDEPTSQLDPGATRQIETMIESLAAEGMTILMTTHDLGQARRLSQRVIFLNKGHIVEDAPTDRFFTQPATVEARAFLAGDLLWQ